MGIVQGSGVDTSLNDHGREQARAFYEAYHTVPFDKVYTSSLKRTLESVSDFLADGVAHEAIGDLNEICWGRKEGQAITPEEDEYYHYLLEQWKLGNTALRIDGGESPEDVQLRLIRGFNHILAREDEKTILICMHGRAIRILLCYLLNAPLSEMDTFEHTNLGLYLLHYEQQKFSMLLRNDLTHLRVLS